MKIIGLQSYLIGFLINLFVKKEIQVFFILFLILTNTSWAQLKSGSGIQFRENTFDEALQIAKKENKLVFLYVYATWCGPCVELKITTFKNKSVGLIYNSTFINLSLNGEKGEGSILSQKYGVQAYPSFFFIRPDGKVLYRAEGFYDSKGFLELGKEVFKISKR
jgi:thioredoxin-related protein